MAGRMRLLFWDVTRRFDGGPTMGPWCVLLEFSEKRTASTSYKLVNKLTNALCWALETKPAGAIHCKLRWTLVSVIDKRDTLPIFVPCETYFLEAHELREDSVELFFRDCLRNVTDIQRYHWWITLTITSFRSWMTYLTTLLFIVCNQLLIILIFNIINQA